MKKKEAMQSKGLHVVRNDKLPQLPPARGEKFFSACNVDKLEELGGILGKEEFQGMNGIQKVLIPRLIAR